ncbi:MAG: DUF2520 domain-containing protein [Syntrophaceae bacterium]|jgi:predicted short-subunit dehydrogenase-like oxidoreductase (DUF2520 family)
MKREKTAILGLGKLGTAAGFLLKQAGYNIQAVASRSESSLQRGLPYTGGIACGSFAEAAAQADCIFITTSDDNILPVCSEIAARGAIGPGRKVIHMSGAAGLDVLAPARQCGADVAAIHPIQSFADIEGAIRNMRGSTFGITCDEHLRQWCGAVAVDLGGRPVYIPEDVKPLYHAAACIASNYLVCLMNTAQGLYEEIGLNPSESFNAFWPLVRGTIRNIEDKGTVQSLTGPIARGDVQTIESHLNSFRSKSPRLLEFYRTMAELTVEVGIKKGTLDPAAAGKIKKLLKEETHEH